MSVWDVMHDDSRQFRHDKRLEPFQSMRVGNTRVESFGFGLSGEYAVCIKVPLRVECCVRSL